jgi:hypothetical protein
MRRYRYDFRFTKLLRSAARTNHIAFGARSVAIGVGYGRILNRYLSRALLSTSEAAHSATRLLGCERSDV